MRPQFYLALNDFNKKAKNPLYLYQGVWVNEDDIERFDDVYAENERGEGVCKVLVDKASRRVLGVHMLGNPCSELIHGACLSIEHGLTVEQLQETVFPHPTVSEILKETLINL